MIRRRKLYSIVLLLAAGSFLWIGFMLWQHNLSNHITLCPIKIVTGYPCPACGTTRSLYEIIRGQFLIALHTNPLGYLALVTSIVFPSWVLIDLLSRKSSFYNFYIKSENLLKKKQVYIPLILLILVNWLWNLIKQM